jgi:hypothetical protein
MILDFETLGKYRGESGFGVGLLVCWFVGFCQLLFCCHHRLKQDIAKGKGLLS